MKEYESCFVGIPLPDERRQELEGLLRDIRQINPLLEASDLNASHITICYLGNQTESSLQEIFKDLSEIDLPKGIELIVGGFGHFQQNDKPIVIFLNVQYPQALRDFYEAVTEVLAKYCDVNSNLPFHPHLTVVNLKSPQAQQSFAGSLSSLQPRLDEVNWEFKITEVVLYGIDPTEQPRHQKKLMVIDVS